MGIFKKNLSGKKTKDIDKLRRELVKKSLWGIPTIIMALDLMSVKAHALTPLEEDPGDPGDINAPVFGRIKKEDKKRNKPRLRPLETNQEIWQKDIWDRREVWKNYFSEDDSK